MCRGGFVGLESHNKSETATDHELPSLLSFAAL